MLRVVEQYAAHRIRGTARGGVEVVGLTLEGERGRGVARKGLEVPDGLAALGEQG